MRHQKHRYRLERFSAARKSLLRNLAASLLEHERIVTTETKAKALKKVAEPLITLGKRGDLAARRRALQILPNNKVVHKLFAEIAPLYAERKGGYTRIMKLSCRQGDAAPMVVIELVGFTERQKAREEEAQAAKEAAEQPKGLRQRLKTKVNKAKKELAQQVDAAKEAAEAKAVNVQAEEKAE